MQRRCTEPTKPFGAAEQGFTLIELMIVVMIVGVLSSVAVPKFMLYMEKARNIEAIENMAKIADAATTYYQANGSMAVSEADEANNTYSGTYNYGYGYGPMYSTICTHGGRATQQDIDSRYGSDQTWNVLRRLHFAPSVGAMFGYYFFGSSDTNTAEATIYAVRQKHCIVGRYYEYYVRMWLADGALRRTGPRLILDN